MTKTFTEADIRRAVKEFPGGCDEEKIQFLRSLEIEGFYGEHEYIIVRVNRDDLISPDHVFGGISVIGQLLKENHEEVRVTKTSLDTFPESTKLALDEAFRGHSSMVMC